MWILSGWEDPIIFGSYCGFKRGGGSKESCERFSSYMTYLTCLSAFILSGWEDSINFRRVIVDLRGVEDLKISCECFYCMAYWSDLRL